MNLDWSTNFSKPLLVVFYSGNIKFGTELFPLDCNRFCARLKMHESYRIVKNNTKIIIIDLYISKTFNCYWINLS